ARVRRQGDKLFKRYFATLDDAEEYERYVKREGKEPPVYLATGALATPGRTFKDVALACKAAGGPRGAWKRSRDHSTPQRLEYCVTQLGDLNIEDVTRAAWRERIVRPLEANGRKQATINRYTAALSAVLTWAVKEDIIKTAPPLDFPKEVDKAERHPISFEEENRICAQLAGPMGHPIDAAVVRFLAWTGLRKGELYRLRPEQIKTDHLTLEREQTKTYDPRCVYVLPDMAREMRA